MRRRIDSPRDVVSAVSIASAPDIGARLATGVSALEDFAARSGAAQPTTLAQYLQTIGLNSLSTGLVEDRVLSLDPAVERRPLADQIQVANQVLDSFWRPAPVEDGGLHVLIGPAGSGKTTALCKWLTQASLIEGRWASLWRLDGVTANQAEHLSVHGEILGVPVERSWPGAEPMGDIGFIDLPGVDWRDRNALQELRRLVEKFGKASVHLVVNGAYETDTLLAQARAFGVLPVVDIIVTHLDEELRWSKLWNLVLGTNLPIGFVGAGQNLPGVFERATSRNLLARSGGRQNGGKGVFSGVSGI
jgi:flagellar biosynthesis GTPase FlhF